MRIALRAMDGSGAARPCRSGRGDLAMLALVPAGRRAVLDDRFPFLEDRRRRYQQQGPRQDYWGSPYGYEQPRQQPVDSSRAPAPRRTDVAADHEDRGVRRLDGRLARLRAGRSVRRDARDRHPAQASHQQRADPRRYPRRVPTTGRTQAREMLNAEKPDFVVMMIGLADRRGIREAIRPAAGASARRAETGSPRKPAQTQPARRAAAGRRARSRSAAPGRKAGRCRSAAEAPRRMPRRTGAAEHHRAGRRDRRHGGARIPLGEMGRALLASASTK